MSSTNRAAVFAKIHKVLKKHYKQVSLPDRPLLDNLLYACVLENSTFEAADESLAKLQELFFNWNEVRVTTVTELSEVMSNLADSREAAGRLKKALQAVFETHYTFDIDFLKKLGQGKALKEFEKFTGLTPFAVAFVTQHGLGGHAIPCNKAALDIFVATEAIAEANAEKWQTPGLERAIPKNKGPEFASLLHQFAVDFGTSPNSQRVKGILAEIDPAAKERIAQRAKQSAEAASQPAPAKKRKTSPGKSPPGKSSPDKSSAAESGKSSKPKANKSDKDEKPKADRVEKKKSSSGAKKPTAASSSDKKSPSKRLTKKKPR
ncbi:MAG: hypothetical protein KDA55_09180 [Planctomycetales bacterium]|nr:hypothetical protein [Planctomycetales bacterium]MCA9208514.1 hypothetical protein [Planctomycetales bacterium]MCA9223877.1 hypothetical protein [Planctomycetales bacterium]